MSLRAGAVGGRVEKSKVRPMALLEGASDGVMRLELSNVYSAKALTVPTSTCMLKGLPENVPPTTIRKKGTYLDTKAISAAKPWTRFPNGTKVRLLEGGQEGLIDGMTELVVGPGRNPDGRTQYRLNVGDQSRLLAGRDDLALLTDNEGLVLIAKQTIEYRRLVTEQLRAELTSDRFVASA